MNPRTPPELAVQVTTAAARLIACLDELKLATPIAVLALRCAAQGLEHAWLTDATPEQREAFSKLVNHTESAGERATSGALAEQVGGLRVVRGGRS